MSKVRDFILAKTTRALAIWLLAQVLLPNGILAILATAARSQDAPANTASSPPTTAAASPESQAGGQPDDSSGLPWRRGPGAPLRMPDQPGQWFDVAGLDASHFSAFRDGAAWSDEFQEPLIKILHRLPQLDGRTWDHWLRLGPALAQAVAQPNSFRLAAVRIRGRATRITRRSFLPELAARFNLEGYYEVELIADDGRAITICALHAPAAWSAAERLDTLAETEAMFLQTLPPGAASSPGSASSASSASSAPAAGAVVAAFRVHWRPERESPELKVTASQAVLAGFGLDAGLLDDLRANNRRPLNDADRDCFYQMLAAARLAGQQDSLSLAPAALDLSALLRRPAELHGQFVAFRFNVRRVTKIQIDDEHARRRLGFSAYFQLDGFAPLGDLKVRLGDDAQHAGATFAERYPASICLVDLPESVLKSVGEVVSGDSKSSPLNLQVDARCFFYRIWSYKTEFVQSQNPRQLQLSPMFMGASVAKHSYQPRSNIWLGAGAGALFLAALAAVWLAIWRSSRRHETRSRRFEPNSFQPPAAD